jgi:hypothetical protein
VLWQVAMAFVVTCLAPVIHAAIADAPRALNWSLGAFKVINPGVKRTLAEGTLTANYVVEAIATGSDTGFVPQGRLQLVLSVFSPSSSRGGQEKGHFYVSGKWSLVDDKAEAAKGRVRPGALTGTLSADLSFNPIANAQPWQAVARVPFSTFIAAGANDRGRKVRGEGAMSVGAKPEGALTLQLKLWPKTDRSASS